MRFPEYEAKNTITKNMIKPASILCVWVSGDAAPAERVTDELYSKLTSEHE